MKKYAFTKSFRFGGKKYNVYGNTLEEVIEKKALKLKDLKEGKVTVSGNMTVSEWSDRCLKVYKPNVSPEYMVQIRGRIRRHILESIGEMKVKDVKPLQCQEILNAQKGRSKSHVTKLHQELCFIFDKAVENKIILESPAAHLTRPDAPEGHRRSITDKEREHFLKVCDGSRKYLLFELILFCGMRPSEAMRARGMDIHIDDGCIFIDVRGTKTANAPRSVPLPVPLYEKIGKISPFDYIAVTEAKTPFSSESYKRLTARLKREMNLSMGCRQYRNELVPPFPLADDFTPYLFRHTFCTDLQKAGVDVRVAQKLMGHADIQTTANIYTHQDDETMKAAARAIGAAYTAAHTSVENARKTV